jgi:hypothetical protein
MLLPNVRLMLEEGLVSEWSKILIVAVAWGVTFYSTTQVMGYRLEKLETDFAKHIQIHDQQSKEILDAITDIKIRIAQLAEVKGR